MRKLLFLVLWSFVARAQEIEIIKPYLGQFQAWYFFDYVGQPWSLTLHATNFRQGDTLLVIRDMMDLKEVVTDTVYIRDFRNDTLKYDFVIHTEEFFMLTFINRRTTTYIHALLTKKLVSWIKDPALDANGELIYYDLQGRILQRPVGFVIDQMGNKYFFKEWAF